MNNKTKENRPVCRITVVVSFQFITLLTHDLIFLYIENTR